MKNIASYHPIFRNYTLLIAFVATFFTAKATTIPTFAPDTAVLPRISILTDVNEVIFERTQRNYSATLIEACRNDMETAHYAWLHLLKHLETFAKQQNVDTDGMKLYLYVFWAKDGSVAHISYFSKPNSRNLREEEVRRFNKLLEDFTKVYKFPIKFERNFSNYNHANFPVLVEVAKATPKQ